MSFTNPQSPGVYIQIKNIGESIISGVSTSTLAVFGRTEMGDTDKPYLVTSFEEFQRLFGGYVADYPDLYNQVMLFFMNGGSRLYVLRMVNGASKSNNIIQVNSVDTWKIWARNEGVWGNDVKVTLIDKGSNKFDISIDFRGSVVEYYENVIFNNRLDSNYVESVINGNSRYITFELLVQNPVSPPAGDYQLSGGLDGLNISLNNYTELFTSNKKFDTVDEILNMIVVDSGLTESDYATLLVSMKSYAESRGDIFIIAHIPAGKDIQNAVLWLNTNSSIKSKYMAIYYPTVKFYDRGLNKNIDIYPDGAIAGIYARVDSEKTVGKSPAGTVDGKLNGILDVSKTLTRGDMDTIYPLSINPIINWVQTGLVVWGVRTLSELTEWRYISAVRVFMFVRKSLYNATHWIVFENNNPTLWFKIKNQLESSLLVWFRDGYFAGAKPSDAFYVICDESNNPPESVNAGIVNIDIGIALNKPAEFVRFRLQQKVNRG